MPDDRVIKYAHMRDYFINTVLSLRDGASCFLNEFHRVSWPSRKPDEP